MSSLGVPHHAGTQGTVTQFPSPPRPHGSCARARRTRCSPGQAGGAECPLQLQIGGEPTCTPKAAPGSAHLLLVLVLQLSIQEVQRHRLTEIDDLQAERESWGRAQGSCSHR